MGTDKTELVQRLAKLSPKQLAFLVIELQQNLDAAERERPEPIAIVGMGCRFPGAADPDGFWRLLHDGVDAIREVPADRWDLRHYYDPTPGVPGKMYTRWGGFVDGVDRFDPQFFGISPREAETMDPQQRLTLEVAWEALEYGGISPARLMRTRTGVFMGVSGSDYAARVVTAGDGSTLDGYVGTGNAVSVLAGRLAYVLGLQGPCLAVDTACSSSLVAVHLASQSLKNRECELAIAGGVSLILAPETNVILCRAGMLARDGRCKTFDAAADGYVRGEGCGIVVLKRLSDAIRDEDRILAVLRASAVNQDGRSNGLTAPNGQVQQELLRETLSRSGLAATDIQYIEAHGTGTALGDPIELQAIGAVLGEGRPADRPLRVGSVKTNIGHLEAAAGVAGLIKVVLDLQHEEISPHLHYRNANPHVPWGRWPLEVVTTRTPWPRATEARRAGVSSFGFSGTNAHVIVEEPPVPSVRPMSVERPRHILTLSARNDAALRELAGRYAARLQSTADSLGDICFTANTGRNHLDNRLAVVAESAGATSDALATFAAGGSPAQVTRGSVRGAAGPEIAFLFAAEGAQYAGMARSLYDTQPVFRRVLEECSSRLEGQLEQSLLSVLYPAEGSPAGIDRAPYTQPALFAVQYAVSELLRSWGIVPSAALGQGVGEYTAACVAGVLGWEDALKLSAARGRLMEDVPPGDVMLPAASPLLDVFERVAAALAHRVPRISFVSSVSGSVVTPSFSFGARYWRRHASETDRYADGLDALYARGSRTFLEVGPSASLIEPGQRTVPAADGMWLSGLRRERGDWDQLLDAVAQLYVRGAAIDWIGFDREYGRRRVALPTNPFQRERFWVDPPDARPSVVPALPATEAPLYEVEWIAKPGAAPQERPATRGRWILLADAGNAARLAKDEIERRGGECVLVTPAEAESGSLRACLGSDPESIAGVLHFGSLDAAIPSDATGLVADLAELFGGLDRARGTDVAPRVWVVTRGAQPVKRSDALSSLQAPVWGFARVAALEHPDVWGGLIDLDPERSGTDTGLMLGDVFAADGEDQIAYRAGGRFVPRLRPIARPAQKRLAVSGDGTYLITGGTGALGLRVARRLVERGARQLVLAGRSGLPPREKWSNLEQSSPTGRQVAQVRALESAGASVSVVRCDTANAADIASLIGSLRSNAAPLRGVVHAAGIVRAVAVADMSPEVVDEILRPKVAGTWLLHEATKDLPLDFFVMFSSVSSVWGSKGLAAYGAANHFQDAVAHGRRASGLPALAVNWGPWAGGGMTTAENRELLAQMGLDTLDPSEALDTLEDLLGSDIVQATVARVDWERFAPVYMAKARRPLLEDLVGAGRPASAGAADGGLADLRAMPPDARARAIEVLVRDAVADVLKIPRTDVDLSAPLNRLGLDSLVAVEVRNRVQRETGALIPVVAFLDGTSAAELAQLALKDLAVAEPPVAAAPAGVTPQEAEALLGRLSELDDEEVDRLLQTLGPGRTSS